MLVNLIEDEKRRGWFGMMITWIFIADELLNFFMFMIACLLIRVNDLEVKFGG